MGYEAFNPGYPVHIYQEGMELPEEGTYYVVAGNGCFLHKDTGLVSCFVPVESIAVLPDLDRSPTVGSRIPKIPARDVYRTKHFFEEVVKKWKTEAIVVPLLNKAKGEYIIEPPHQSVSPCGVQYLRPTAGEQGFLRIGTIHSHSDFGAFHSGVDVGDEDDWDGIHVTFGDNNKEVFSIATSIVVNGYRLQIDPMRILEGIEPEEEEVPLPAKYSREQKRFFRLTEVDDETKEKWLACLPTWMERVKYRESHFKLVRNPETESAFHPTQLVTWRGDMNQVSLKTLYGDGPFEIEHITEDKCWLTIRTDVGPAIFNVKLFRHACEECDEQED